jgi:hypothetical protein
MLAMPVPGPNVIKLFCPYYTRVLVPDKLLQVILTNTLA